MSTGALPVGVIGAGPVGLAACCGGPAPARVVACCIRDAEAKAVGQDRCGCGSTSQDVAEPAPAEARRPSLITIGAPAPVPGCCRS